jgi:hypothetical protein
MSNVSDRDVVIDLRHKSEDATRILYERMIDDRNALEIKVAELEKENFDLRSSVIRKMKH